MFTGLKDKKVLITGGTSGIGQAERLWLLPAEVGQSGTELVEGEAESIVCMRLSAGARQPQ